MAEPAVRRMPSGTSDQSIGDLVSVAARDISQLVRYELELARLELKHDVKRLGMGAALGAVAVFALCLIVLMLCVAFALGLAAIHVVGGLWGAFLFAALACLLLFAILGAIAFLLVRRLTKMRKTRDSVADGVSMLRHIKPRQPAGVPTKAD